MQIGLFGGTFNPIHFGHLRTALEIKEAFKLDKIYFIPSAIPPHKTPDGVADAKDRYQMIRLAISDQNDLMVSDVELDRPGPSYSIDTVTYFQSVLSDNTGLYLILGIDAFLEIDTWKSYRDFFDRVPFIVMKRPGKRQSSQPEPEKQEILEPFLQLKISKNYRFSADQSCYIHEKKQPVFKADVTALDISSTKIRILVKQGRSIRYLVPESVASYIRTKGLYV